MIKLTDEERLLERAEGKQEGIREGKQKGLQEGRKEKALAVAKNMLADGLSPNVIAKYTNLSETEIIALL